MRSDRGERRSLGDAPAAGRAKRRHRALAQPGGFLEKAGCREETGRHIEASGERVDAGFGEFQLDRNNGGNRPGREARLGEGIAGESLDLIGGNAALAADPDREQRGVIDQCAAVRRQFPIGDDDFEVGLLRPFDPAGT